MRAIFRGMEWLGLTVALFLPPPPPAMPTAYKGVVILNADNDGADGALADEWARDVADQIEELGNHQAISPLDTRTEVEPYGLSAVACEHEVVCLAHVGRYARGSMVLESRLQALAGDTLVSVRAIDTEAGRETNRVAFYLSQEHSERLQQIQQMVVHLVTPQAYIGSLAIDCPNDGAEVYVDDHLVSHLPLPEPLVLEAGTHILRLSKGGFEDINRFVDVVFHRLTTVKANLADRTVTGTLVERQSPHGLGGIFVLSQDEGWGIRIDGELLRFTPMTEIYPVAVGHHRLSLRKLDSKPIVQDVDIELNRRADFVLTHTASGAQLRPLGVVALDQPLPVIPLDAGSDVMTQAPEPIAELHERRILPAWQFYTGLGIGMGGLILPVGLDWYGKGVLFTAGAGLVIWDILRTLSAESEEAPQ